MLVEFKKTATSKCFVLSRSECAKSVRESRDLVRYATTGVHELEVTADEVASEKLIRIALVDDATQGLIRFLLMG